VLAGAIDRLVPSQMILFLVARLIPGTAGRAESYGDIHSSFVAIPAPSRLCSYGAIAGRVKASAPFPASDADASFGPSAALTS
jgi:hypothetical protein